MATFEEPHARLPRGLQRRVGIGIRDRREAISDRDAAQTDTASAVSSACSEDSWGVVSSARPASGAWSRARLPCADPSARRARTRRSREVRWHTACWMGERSSAISSSSAPGARSRRCEAPMLRMLACVVLLAGCAEQTSERDDALTCGGGALGNACVKASAPYRSRRVRSPRRPPRIDAVACVCVAASPAGRLNRARSASARRCGDVPVFLDAQPSAAR